MASNFEPRPMGSAENVKVTDGTFTVGVSDVGGVKALKVDVVQTVGGEGGPSGGLTDAQLRATPVPVTGAVTGPLTDAQLRATAVPVSGTFWPGTQPVSGTVTANAGTGPWPVTDNGGSLTVDGTVAVSGSVAVTGPLTDAQLRATAVPVSTGTVAVTGPLTDAQLRATAVGVSGPLTDAQLRATAVPISGTVTANTGTLPALTKGTQGTTGFSVQALKDAERQHVSLNWEEMAGTANAESALTNFTSGSRGGSALAAANSYTVQAGKTLRIHAVSIYVKATSTVNNLARFRIRQAATVANNSPIIFDRVCSIEANAVAANASHSEYLAIPEGIEVAAGQQITFTWFTAANTCTVGMQILAYEY